MALFVFVARVHSFIATKLVLIVQTILGYYIFIVFMFAIPAVQSQHFIQRDVMLCLTIAANQFLIVLDMLTSFQFYLALQVGQFVVTV